jgi:hypothetical protein
LTAARGAAMVARSMVADLSKGRGARAGVLPRVACCLAPAALLLTGCAITIPEPVQPLNHKYIAESLGSKEKPDEAGANSFEYCERTINGLLSVARAQRNIGASLSIVGGLISAAGGVTGSIVNEKSDVAKVIFTIISGSGAIVALLSPYIGNPSSTLSAFSRGKSHHDSAEGMIRKIGEAASGEKKSALYEQFFQEVHACGGDGLVDVNVGPAPPVNQTRKSAGDGGSSGSSPPPSSSGTPPPVLTGPSSQVPPPTGTAPLVSPPTPRP